jgi:hypothetical protein
VVDARTSEVLAHKGEYSNLASTTYAKEHPEKYFVDRWSIREIGLSNEELQPLTGKEVCVLGREFVITGILEYRKETNLWEVSISGALVTFSAKEVWEKVQIADMPHLWLKRPTEPNCHKGDMVRTPEGYGEVERVSPPMRRVWVRLEAGGVKEFSSKEFNSLQLRYI